MCRQRRGQEVLQVAGADYHSNRTGLPPIERHHASLLALLHFLKIKQRSKKEPSHSRDGTPGGEVAIPYSSGLEWDLMRPPVRVCM